MKNAISKVLDQLKNMPLEVSFNQVEDWVLNYELKAHQPPKSVFQKFKNWWLSSN